MAAKIKIGADTSEAKKSILGLSKDLKNIKESKVSIFTQEDKKFIKTEMKREVENLKKKLQENRDAISQMVEEQSKLVSGSKEELEMRNKILAAYRTQAKLGKDLGDVKKASKGDIPGGGGGGILDKGMSFITGTLPKLLGGAALAVGGMAIMKTIEATGQYVGGTSNRNKLKGLGVNDENFGKPEDLARVGLTEQEMIQRRAEATSVLGRKGTNNETEMKKAGFERAYGLEGGTMTGVAAQFRGQVGGQGATDMQMKLQASILAAGIEDAIGPYLESAVSLLTSINENGTTNTSEMTSLFAQLAKEGQRTPELMGKEFGGVNSAVQGAKGEQSAFLQTAFARAGIGGGTVGGTKFAMSSGGIMGMNQDELAKRGYNPELLKDMEKNGMFSGVGNRTNAIMDQFHQSAGLKKGEKISDIKDTNRMVGVGNLANSVFNTKGDQGFDVLMMLEKVQNKQMSQKQFDSKLKEMQESKDPVVNRLDKINESLSGQTQILTLINENQMEALGKHGVVTRNEFKKTENEGIKGATNLTGAINDTGIIQGTGGMINRGLKAINNGGIGESLFDHTRGLADDAKMEAMTSKKAIEKKRKEMMKTWYPGKSDEEIAQLRKDRGADSSDGQTTQPQQFPTAKDIGKEVGNAIKGNIPSPTVNVKSPAIQMPDGTITERANK